MTNWIKTTDRLPEKPGKRSYEYVTCLIAVKGRVEVGHWNCEHECWDDDDEDDFRYDATEPTHWMMPFPDLPDEVGEPEHNTSNRGE